MYWFLTLAMAATFWAATPAASQDVLRVGTTALPPSLGNPYRVTGAPHIYTWSATFDGLTRIDRAGTLQPWLAKSWTTVDGQTWEIKLRDDVVFSNGRPFTAESVVTVLEWLASDAALREAVAREFDVVDTAEAIDPHKVRLKTKTPATYLMRAMPLLHIVEPQLWSDLGPEGFAQAPVGTGPFHPIEFGATRITYEAVPTSWRAPKIDRMEMIAAPDASTRSQAVIANQLDIALVLGPEETEAIEAFGGIGMGWQTAALQTISFHHGKGTPLDDLRVRKALNLAVDRQTLIQLFLQGLPEQASQPAVSFAYGYNTDLEPIPFDPDLAKELLSEAGYPNGFKFIMQGAVGSGANDAIIYQKVAQDLASIGVEMEIRTFPISQLIRGVMEGQWNGDAFAIAVALAPTVDSLRATRNHSCLWSHPWYCDERIMPAVNEAWVTADAQRGLDLRQEIMKFYRDEYAALYLYQLVRFAGMKANVRGFSEVHGFVSFDEIYFEDH